LPPGSRMRCDRRAGRAAPVSTGVVMAVARESLDPRSDPRESAPRPALAAPAPDALLALQRGAGNAAVTRLLQRTRINVPGRGEIETNDYTEAELMEMAIAPGSLPATQSIFAAIDAGETKPTEFAALRRDIQDFLDEDLIDTETYLPLSGKEAEKVKLPVKKDLSAVNALEKHYDPANKKTFLAECAKIRKALDELRERYVATGTDDELDDYVDDLIAGGLELHPEFALASKELRGNPGDVQGYVRIKKLIGECLGQERLSRELVGERGEKLYDHVLTEVFILERKPLPPDFKDGFRQGRISGEHDTYGYVIGELDNLFVFIDPMTTKYIPTIILESKGGALSSAAVAQQKRKEGDRLGLVVDDPRTYALAKRDKKDSGPFRDITNRFDFGFSGEDVAVLSSGPTREGAQQYDVDLGIDSRTIEKLARYFVYLHARPV
jgi:hypothetical protein